ncbi:hypothetical protein BABINDRAFT_158841 [Babjeviella inositovora NRRL Y-12698]|uniref:C2H2-type domain-containing protein n=1 Tax=Babjeviella inositovora NRRL Y-12698 TaxID=984486 RepID=A0A1E3QXC8_9ASCO|nr:uncharacterized protein BABINDRAFT_158841 [Babjeviella inositovora NRRL Y-12698]ODQ82194.1 hypothetical protein BABINDRAFT_158841 [Babjeviella inositovora NRRL Y-12698]
MGRYSVKRYKTKRRTRDLDSIFYEDLASAERRDELLNKQPLDETKPGLGQHYCIECAKYFENKVAIKTHLKGGIHKRRVKDLNARPYTPLESLAASGTNMELFAQSVEKYKMLDAQRKIDMAKEAELVKQQEEAEEAAKKELEAVEAAEIASARAAKKAVNAPAEEVDEDDNLEDAKMDDEVVMA